MEGTVRKFNAYVIRGNSATSAREPVELSVFDSEGNPLVIPQPISPFKNSSASDVSGLKTDFNALLAALRSAGMLDVETPIDSSQRATPNGVGYLGVEHTPERTLNIGDALPSDFSGCVWDDTVLRVNSSGKTIDNWRINAGIDCYGTDLTITNCLIVPPEGTSFYGVYLREGTLTITDTSVLGAGTSFEQGNAVSHDDAAGIILATRCELTGYQDAIGITHGIISQCWIHDIALAGSFHSDGIQIFGDLANDVLIEHCYIDITGPNGQSTDDEHQNACVYTDLPTGPANGVIVDNCYMVGGTYEIMLSADPQDVSITNCNFGPVDSHGLGEITATESTVIISWSYNRNSSGEVMDDPTV